MKQKLNIHTNVVSFCLLVVLVYVHVCLRACWPDHDIYVAFIFGQSICKWFTEYIKWSKRNVPARKTITNTQSQPMHTVSFSSSAIASFERCGLLSRNINPNNNRYFTCVKPSRLIYMYNTHTTHQKQLERIESNYKYSRYWS